MKVKAVRPRSDFRGALNEPIGAEMQIFLQALNSYAARVAADPDLTFQQHCRSLMQVAGAAQRPPQKIRIPKR
jgi:hypothetical protein